MKSNKKEKDEQAKWEKRPKVRNWSKVCVTI